MIADCLAKAPAIAGRSQRKLFRHRGAYWKSTKDPTTPRVERISDRRVRKLSVSVFTRWTQKSAAPKRERKSRRDPTPASSRTRRRKKKTRTANARWRHHCVRGKANGFHPLPHQESSAK